MNNPIEKLFESVDEAVKMKAGTMIEFIDDAFDGCIADDQNDKTASITIPIKLTIRRNARTGYSFNTRVQVKRIETELGEYTTTFNPAEGADLFAEPAQSDAGDYEPERADAE